MKLHIAPKCDTVGYNKIKPYIADAFEYQILGDDFSADFKKIKGIVLDNPGLTTLVVHENLYDCSIENIFNKYARYRKMFSMLASFRDELNEQGRQLEISVLLHVPEDTRYVVSEMVTLFDKLSVLIDEYGIRLLVENLTRTPIYDSLDFAAYLVAEYNHDNCKLCLDLCHAEIVATQLAKRENITLDEARRTLFPAKTVKSILGWVHFSRMIGDGYGMNHSVACSNSDEVAELVEKYDYLGLKSVTLCMEVLEPDGYEERAAEIAQIKSIIEYNKKGGFD